MRGVIPFRPRAVVGLIALLLVGVTPILCAPITLELAGGSVIKGDLISWNRQEAVVKAEFGSMTFKRDQLSQATLQKLELLSGDPQMLVARISELEATVESLRKDNAALNIPITTPGRLGLTCATFLTFGFLKVLALTFYLAWPFHSRPCGKDTIANRQVSWSPLDSLATPNVFLTSKKFGRSLSLSLGDLVAKVFLSPSGDTNVTARARIPDTGRFAPLSETRRRQ